MDDIAGIKIESNMGQNENNHKLKELKVYSLITSITSYRENKSINVKNWSTNQVNYL